MTPPVPLLSGVLGMWRWARLVLMVLAIGVGGVLFLVAFIVMAIVLAACCGVGFG